MAILFFLCFSEAKSQILPFVLDSTYGTHGITSPLTHGNSIWLHHMLGSAIQSDGKIVMAGTGNFQNNLEVVRLNTNGTLDTSFNHTGYNFYNGNANGPWTFIDIKVAASGKILVAYYSLTAGNSRMTVRSILPNGAVDAAFGIGGKAEVGPSLAGYELLMTAMDVRPDGKILMVGGGPDAMATHKYVMARINTNGIVDSTFGTYGLAKCPYYINVGKHVIITTISLQNDGKILVAGTIPPGPQGNPDTMILIRYKENGTLDSTYGNNGNIRYATQFQPGITRMDAANNLFMVGRVRQFSAPDTLSIMKFNAAGAIVTSFGTNGLATVKATLNAFNAHEQINSKGRFALLPDGSMVVSGNSDSSSQSAYRVCKLLQTGAMDTTFSTNGFITVARNKRDFCSNLVVQPDGKIVLTGFYRTGEGSFDTARVLAMRFKQMQKGGQPGAVKNVLLVNGTIYPNPIINNHFTLEYNNEKSAGAASYEMMNSMGQVITSGNFRLASGKSRHDFHLNDHLASGHYYLRIYTDNAYNSFRLFVPE